MAPITSEGNRDFEKISLIVFGKSKISAHPVLSKYRIETEDDFTNTLSSLVPHPIALAFQFKRRNMEGQQYNGMVQFRHKVCIYIRDYAKLILLDSIGIAEVSLQRDKLVRQRKSQRQANIFWNNKICTCILCKRITMKIYGGREWKNCAECKGWVCPYCDCEPYHLSHLTATLLETLEPAQTLQDQNDKSSKRKPKSVKKVALGPTTTNNCVRVPAETGGSKIGRHCCSVISPSNLDPENIPVQSSHDATALSSYLSMDPQVPSEERIDFVQYLQETKSILALAHLMDDLESQGYDFDGRSSSDTLIVDNE